MQSDDDQQLRDLLEELRTQIDRAEAERLADPWFIEDLRDLVARYDQQAYEAVYEQDFVAEGPAGGAVSLAGFGWPRRHGLELRHRSFTAS